MQSTVRKQYLLLQDKPVLYYSLKTFEESRVSDILLVVGKGEVAFCRREIVEKYHFNKVVSVIEGGKERYNSVFAALQAAEGTDYVLIHDGVRPFVTDDMINRTIEAARQCGACVVGMPVKDTIKIVDEDGMIKATPERRTLWQIQTPQVFSYPLIYAAYRKLMENGGGAVTDDAMVVESMEHVPVKVVKGSYQNIKITTPEDLLVAEAYLR